MPWMTLEPSNKTMVAKIGGVCRKRISQVKLELDGVYKYNFFFALKVFFRKKYRPLNLIEPVPKLTLERGTEPISSALKHCLNYFTCLIGGWVVPTTFYSLPLKRHFFVCSKQAERKRIGFLAELGDKFVRNFLQV